MFYIILYILYIGVVIMLIMNLLLYGTRPTKTLSWLLAIIILPILGILMYLFFGLNRRKQKIFNLKKTSDLKRYFKFVEGKYKSIGQEEAKEFPEVAVNIKLAKMVMKTSYLVVTGGNKVTVLNDGPETFKSIFEAMEKARKFIHIQYYIYQEGELAERFAGIFERKEKEGIEVRLIYDSVGSWGLSEDYLERLRNMGAEACAFMPVRFGRFADKFNYRNHRKIIVIDGEVGFTGGINVDDKYIKGDPVLGHWRDTHLKLEGPAAAGLNNIFAADWHFVNDYGEDLLKGDYFPAVPHYGKSAVQILAGGPDNDFPSVQQQYFTIVNQADRYVYIANSYIIPGEGMLLALKTAAMSGVDVRILVPESSDSLVVKWSIRSYFAELLEAGVQIFLYRKGFLHSKIIVADDNICSIGTANMDIRSFEQNFEVNAIIYDEEIAGQVRDSFLVDCEKSKLLRPEVFARRSRKSKLIEGAARIFSPLL